MSIQLKQSASFATEKVIAAATHVLFVLPTDQPAALPCA